MRYRILVPLTIDRIKVNVSDGAPEGFGIVLLKSGSPNLCVAVADKLEGHRELLLHDSDKISLDMQSDVVLKNTTIDDAFIAFQKHQCGAIYASAANLKILTGALTRAGESFSFSSLWLLPPMIEAQDAAIAEKNRVEEQAATERAQRNADQDRLAAARAKDFNATRGAQQAELRVKFGDSGKAASAALSSEIIAWDDQQMALRAKIGDSREVASAAANSDVNVSDEKSHGSIGVAYPKYSAWLTDLLADHWEITTTDSELHDFGTSNYKGRSLDTVFSRITLHLKNRILGQYSTKCFVFGRINDSEFAISREFMVDSCDDEATLAKWQAGHEFKSEWIVFN
jgi:hypothetical protein